MHIIYIIQRTLAVKQIKLIKTQKTLLLYATVLRRSGSDKYVQIY